MFLRPIVFALVLVAGTAAAAPAQSDEYPFRRFRPRATPQLHFSFDNSFRLKSGTERLRTLALARAHALAERARSRQFASRDREFALRNRAFDMVDRAHRRELELRSRGMDRLRERLERFKMDRPVRIKRHSGII